MKDAQLAKAFRVAQKHLWTKPGDQGQANRICEAIRDAWCQDKISGETRDRARSLVMSRLGSSVTLRGWLYAQGVPAADLTVDKVQAHRLAWCKLLEAEFKE